MPTEQVCQMSEKTNGSTAVYYICLYIVSNKDRKQCSNHMCITSRWNIIGATRFWVCCPRPGLTQKMHNGLKVNYRLPRLTLPILYLTPPLLVPSEIAIILFGFISAWSALAVLESTLLLRHQLSVLLAGSVVNCIYSLWLDRAIFVWWKTV